MYSEVQQIFNINYDSQTYSHHSKYCKVMVAYTLEKAAKGERAPKKRLCPKNQHKNKAKNQGDERFQELPSFYPI